MSSAAAAAGGGGTPAHDQDALPQGTRLAEFEILHVLGVGGFGIVYLARDHALDRLIALKEYMPSMMAARGDGLQVSLRSHRHQDTFNIGLRSFVNEAKLLARFDHPSLVKVYRFWEGNGTAYMAMPYYPGRTLRDERRSMSRPPDEAWLRAVVDPLLSAMAVLHKDRVYHRDIAPDNILLLPDAPPVLLDFGAARAVIGDKTQTLTAVLKPSYAPIEQYADVSHLRQGPWTDLYALGAVMHFVVTGQTPIPSASRAVQDERVPLSSPASAYAGVMPLRVLRAIDWALAVRPSDRPQDVGEFREALDGLRLPPGAGSDTEPSVPGGVDALPRQASPHSPGPSGAVADNGWVATVLGGDDPEATRARTLQVTRKDEGVGDRTAVERSGGHIAAASVQGGGALQIDSGDCAVLSAPTPLVSPSVSPGVTNTASIAVAGRSKASWLVLAGLILLGLGAAWAWFQWRGPAWGLEASAPSPVTLPAQERVTPSAGAAVPHGPAPIVDRVVSPPTLPAAPPILPPATPEPTSRMQATSALPAAPSASVVVPNWSEAAMKAWAASSAGAASGASRAEGVQPAAAVPAPPVRAPVRRNAPVEARSDPSVSAGPASPREVCRTERSGGSMQACMRRLCANGPWVEHAQCVQHRRDDAW